MILSYDDAAQSKKKKLDRVLLISLASRETWESNLLVRASAPSKPKSIMNHRIEDKFLSAQDKEFLSVQQDYWNQVKESDVSFAFLHLLFASSDVLDSVVY